MAKIKIKYYLIHLAERQGKTYVIETIKFRKKLMILMKWLKKTKQNNIHSMKNLSCDRLFFTKLCFLLCLKTKQ